MMRSANEYRLPRCFLLQALADRVASRTDVTFCFLGELQRLRDTVAPESGYIVRVFPEYTPHTDEHHLSHLFHIADRLLGRGLVSNLNSAELFLLSAALYAHDWGMAISESGEALVTGESSFNARLPRELGLLDHERDRFQRHLRDAFGADTPAEVPRWVWQDYVRKTHAERSSERAYRYFEHIHSGVANAVAKLCKSHWLDHRDLEDSSAFPVNVSVLAEPVNLRAIAIYLRLIDLFDLGNDRTPYVLWKFVSPQNPASALEWNKHRGLSQITCPDYLGETRVVQVDGSTRDHEVFAALEDLRGYCEAELRAACDLLSRMHDHRYSLNLHHVNWRVTARGFSPVSMRFEFDRQSVFGILGAELYQGDTHVFLRELLQNSIDAIRLRRGVLQRHGASGMPGKISVEVHSDEAGNFTVTWEDNGCGMNEHILRDYFAVVGHSYYRSPDFEKLGIELDPISRFGIGVLSCFMVADSVEVETRLDPYLDNSAKTLRVFIPDPGRQFRIQQLSTDYMNPGTRVTVHISQRALQHAANSRDRQELHAAEYLTMVAGFVPFPVHIREKGKEVRLLPPSSLPASGNTDQSCVEARQLKASFPLEHVFPAQDVDAASLLPIRVLDLKADLGLEDYEGWLISLVPPDSTQTCEVRGSTGKRESVALLDRNEEVLVEIPVRSANLSLSTGEGIFDKIAQSACWHRWGSLYRDGILVPEAVPSRRAWPIRNTSFFLPYLVVNVTSDVCPSLNISRAGFRTKNMPWGKSIRYAFLEHLRTENALKLGDADPMDRLRQLALLAQVEGLTKQEAVSLVPLSDFPLLILRATEGYSCVEWSDFSEREFAIMPEFYWHKPANVLRAAWRGQGEPRLPEWVGRDVVVSESPFGGPISTAQMALDIQKSFIRSQSRVVRMDFLRPLGENNLPLAQVIREPLPPEFLRSRDELLAQVVSDPVSLLSVGAQRRWGDPLEKVLPVQLAPFGKPFDDKLAYGLGTWNLKHPTTQSLLRVAASLELREQQTTSRREMVAVGQALDVLREFRPFDTAILSSGVKLAWLQDLLLLVAKLAAEAGIEPGSLAEKITPDSFVSGTLTNAEDEAKILCKSETRTLCAYYNKSDSPLGAPFA